MPLRTRESRLSGAYWRLWLATGIDNIGNGAYVAAVPLLAVSLTQDPRLVTLVATATYLPWLLVSLQAGALVDRVDRVTLMRRCQLVAATVVSCTAVLIALDEITIAGLAVLAFVLGTCDVAFANAAQAVLPDVVPKHVLHRANGNQQAMITVGQQFIGPPVGSSLFVVSAALPFGVDACSFVLSASILSKMPRRSPPPARESIRAAIASGLRWLMRHRLMRTLAILVAVNLFCWQMANATLVLLATQTLHLDARAYGVLLASAAVGGILGALVNARVVQRIGPLPAILSALATNVMAFIGSGLSPNTVTLGVFLAISAFATTLWNIVTTTLRQQVVPSDMLGRVNSVYKMLGWSLIPLGTLTGGLVAHELGLRAPQLVAGTVRAIALLVVLPVLLTAMRGATRHGERSPRENQ
ncbi:MFS transporter [Actinocrispum wychmicini]|uniref:Putative MFS family arabinose efflux permease n=1 Tax=Actinocrispum wychmicini TaxID=1213861 RepID=A0A4R2JCH1_9PSEU|nr:MFS transporter [Actinocrispum wychmicini]TCO55712.1 putative MFS family arabinose efflux permease [Actinocrispum wychmicini]